MIRYRRILISGLCLITAAISAFMFARWPSGRVAWVLCLLGSAGVLF